jgi:hypothetical protein
MNKLDLLIKTWKSEGGKYKECAEELEKTLFSSTSINDNVEMFYSSLRLTLKNSPEIKYLCDSYRGLVISKKIDPSIFSDSVFEKLEEHNEEIIETIGDIIRAHI